MLSWRASPEPSLSERTGHNERMPNLLDIPVETIGGQPTSLAAYREKVLLVLNVASKCGFTSQYTALEALYQRFKDRGLVVLGFPANDFGAQEPGTNEEIATFCSTEYPVTFPLFSKMAVTGPDKHPLYTALIAAQPDRLPNGDDLRQHLADFSAENNLPGPNAPPELLWNFEKFLVGRNGQVLARFASDVTPDDPRLIEAIEAAL